MENRLIPEQIQGKQLDVQSDQDCGSLEVAIMFYLDVKTRLLDVNRWKEVSGNATAEFQLTDKGGNPISDFTEGCLIRIDIPGPGTSAGDGFDWVEVEEVAHQQGTEYLEWTGFRVRPCANPHHPGKGTAHFFSKCATSTFLVKRIGQVVIAEVHGRNEQPNDEISGIKDTLRNAVVGIAAKLGMSFPQWKLLTEGLVNFEQQ